MVDETSRYEGFEIGQPVFVVGRSRGDNDGLAFEAYEIYGGNRAAYVAFERTAGWIFLIIGVVIGLIGGGIALRGILS